MRAIGHARGRLPYLAMDCRWQLEGALLVGSSGWKDFVGCPVVFSVLLLLQGHRLALLLKLVI